MTYLDIARTAVSDTRKTRKVPADATTGYEINEINEKSPAPDAAALVPSLAAGWSWLAAHPDHPEHEPFLGRWLARLHEYERACVKPANAAALRRQAEIIALAEMPSDRFDRDQFDRLMAQWDALEAGGVS